MNIAIWIVQGLLALLFLAAGLLKATRPIDVLASQMPGIYRSFDSYRIEQTLTSELHGWLRNDLGIHPDPLILVVEDDDAMVEALTGLLVGEGYRVARATNGREALDMVAKEQPDLIVLSDLMPVMDGFAALPELRKLTDAPILFLGVLEPWRFHGGLKAGADDFLLKPFDIDELFARVISLLRRRGRLST